MGGYYSIVYKVATSIATTDELLWHITSVGKILMPKLLKKTAFIGIFDCLKVCVVQTFHDKQYVFKYLHISSDHFNLPTGLSWPMPETVKKAIHTLKITGIGVFRVSIY